MSSTRSSARIDPPGVRCGAPLRIEDARTPSERPSDTTQRPDMKRPGDAGGPLEGSNSSTCMVRSKQLAFSKHIKAYLLEFRWSSACACWIPQRSRELTRVAKEYITKFSFVDSRSKTNGFCLSLKCMQDCSCLVVNISKRVKGTAHASNYQNILRLPSVHAHAPAGQWAHSTLHGFG